MARNVNVRLANFRNTGVNVSIPQRALDITVDWTNDAGQPQTATRTLLFPNFLGQRGNEWLRRKLEELMYQAARIELGMDVEGEQA